jgi:hypothetical protein
MALRIRCKGDNTTLFFFGETAEGVFWSGHIMQLIKTTGKFDALAESEWLESKVPMICLATGCVSGTPDIL